MYARFLEAVKNDPWSASKWSAQAEELFAAEEDAKNNVFADLDDAMANQESDGEDDNEAVKRARALKAHMEDARGVIIISECVAHTNIAVCRCWFALVMLIHGQIGYPQAPAPYINYMLVLMCVSSADA